MGYATRRRKFRVVQPGDRLCRPTVSRRVHPNPWRFRGSDADKRRNWDDIIR